MIYFIKVLILIILSLGFSASCHRQKKSDKNDEIKRSEYMNTINLKFFDIDQDSDSIRETKYFSVFGMLSEVQSASQGGIEIKIIFKYEGENEIAIHNPLYFFQHFLSDHNQDILETNIYPSILLINKIGPIDEKNFNFSILKIERNKEELSIGKQLNEPTLTFQKGMEQNYVIQIAEYINPQTKQIEKLPIGEYTLEFLVSIVTLEKSDGEPVSRTLKTEEVKISLKE